MWALKALDAAGCTTFPHPEADVWIVHFNGHEVGYITSKAVRSGGLPLLDECRAIMVTVETMKQITQALS